MGLILSAKFRQQHAMQARGHANQLPAPRQMLCPRTRPPEPAQIQLVALVVKARAALSTRSMSSFTSGICVTAPSRPHPVLPSQVV